MPPSATPFLRRASIANPSSTSDELREQWVHPSDIFTVLLLLGGDVVGRAVAQLAGSSLTPVTFSFGWVAYSLSALVSAVGENKLMPQTPDCQCKVINGKAGTVINNSSWILGRIVRDFDSWSGVETKQKTVELLNERWAELKKVDPTVGRPSRAGLVVSIYKPSTARESGVPSHDRVYWSGIVTIVIQLGIAAVPCGVSGNWGILLITACGTVLALLTGLLPQWKKEKWACRRHSNDAYVLTRGNGAQHAIAILANGRGLNLEDLAAGQNNLDASANNLTRLSILVLSTLWILLLITAAGLKSDAWYLLAVGGIGILHNIFVAGWSRRPENFGVPLEFVQVIGKTRVMKTLIAVEEAYPALGRSMRDEFFPGKITAEEVRIWDELEQKALLPVNQTAPTLA